MITVVIPLQDRLEGSFEIVNGPGKWDMFVALGENTSDDPHYVVFNFDPKMTTDATDPRQSATMLLWVKVALNSLGREDGSGQKWLFEGFIPHSHQNVKGYFNLQTRKGWIEFLPN